MPPKNNNDQSPDSVNLANYEKYLELTGYHKLPTPDHQESIAELIAEGQRIIDREERAKKKKSPPVPEIKKDDTKKLSHALMATSKNPYIRAKAQLLDQWMKDPKLAWRAKEVLSMEAGELPKNQHYDEFVHEIAILGDKMS